MDLESRFSLVKQVGEEIVTEPELKELLERKAHPIAYDGFEPSGTDIHIAQGILRAVNVNKMAKAGVKFKMLVADWHAWANNKMGGDLEKIQTVGKYFVEVWKTCGMDLDNVEFVWASDLLKETDYWKMVMQVSRNSTLSRVLRTVEIMGRKETDSLQASQIIYPCMQAADIFKLQADICQLGMDQRKVNVLARELGPKLGFWKPVIISHHMLMGLQQPKTGAKDAVERAIAMKMSKSLPDTAIFMNDSEEDVKRKVSKAYCPVKQVDENPLMEYCKFIVFEKFGVFEIKRSEKFGGSVSFDSYSSLAASYAQGEIHPTDLKNAVAEKISELVSPVREHFESNQKARKLRDQVRSFQVTR